MLKKIKDYFVKRNNIRKAIEELSAYSDRDLADIGISRADIEFIVRQGQIT